MSDGIPAGAVFAFNTVFKSMEVFAAHAEAVARVPGLEIAEGDWLFFAADGLPLAAVFSTDPMVQEGGRWVMSNGVYDLQPAEGPNLPAFLFYMCKGTDGVWMRTTAEVEAYFGPL